MMRSSIFVLFSTALAPAQAPRVSAPILTLEIDAVDAFAETRLVREMRAAWQGSASQHEELRAGVEEALRVLDGLGVPVRIDMVSLPRLERSVVFAARDLGRTWTQAGREAVLAMLRRPAARPGGFVHDRGDLLLLGEVPEGQVPDLDSLATAIASAVEAPRSGALAEIALELGAAPVRFHLDFNALLRALPTQGRQAIAAVRMLLGPVAGGSFAVRPVGEAIESVGAFDVGSATGLLGRMFHAPARVPPLWNRVPDGDVEFTLIDLSIDGIAALVDLVRTFVGSDDFPLDELVAFLRTHLDGQILILTEPSTAAEAVDPDAEEPVVFVLGSPDAKAARTALAATLVELGLERLDEADDDAASWSLGIGHERLFELAAESGMLAVLNTDPRSRTLWSRSLAAEPRDALPAALPERFRSGFTMLARSSLLSGISGEVAKRDLQDRSLPASLGAIARVIEAMDLGSFLTAARVDEKRSHYWSRL